MTTSPEDGPRITDLSSIDAEDFKYRNTQFLMDEEQTYETGMDESQQELRHRIWVIRNGDLRKVLRRFPTDEPLVEQCALWMHAIVGKHFFSDANHRTAVALLRKLLRENGIVHGAWSLERLKAARDRSHDVRQDIEQVRLDTLYRRDKLYEVWLEFFQEELSVLDLDEE